MDKYERFLRGEMSLLRFAELLDLPEFPLHAFPELQNAHYAIINQPVKHLETILRNYRAGKVSREDFAQVIGMNTKDLDDLFPES